MSNQYFSFYFLNMEVSLDIHLPFVILFVHVNNILLERRVSQISYLSLSLYLILKSGNF